MNNTNNTNNTGAPIWAECISQTEHLGFSESNSSNNQKIFFSSTIPS